MFHKDWTINVTSRELTIKMRRTLSAMYFNRPEPTNVLTMFYEDWIKHNAPPPGGHAIYGKNAPPSGGHSFQQTGTIFKLIQDIIRTCVLTKFHEDWTIHATSWGYDPPPGSHVFQQRGTVANIIRTNILTKFREDSTKYVTSIVLTRKNATPPGGNFFQRTKTIFQLK
ncbi:hypothetical protein DPMN_185845 [Dreissena polymorpha]|uniref:Uncharacterized protein n=1 Tax=Dreissena polymorpha TaxID=45954 RepID=A0A9D4DKI3_DREPO|nr:hypothetical protein DPMN_185845 [Dreissena polymorpha]